MTAVATLCGAGVGLGLVIIWAGLRGVDLARPTRASARPNVERANLRIGLAAGAAVIVGAATGWPVGALLAALAGWGAPGLLAGTRGAQAAVGRIEAIAGWAEMLRDTMAGAAGTDQAVLRGIRDTNAIGAPLRRPRPAGAARR